MGHVRLLFPVRRPVVAHRVGAVAAGDRARAVLVALRADVLGRVACADDQHVLVLELQRVAKIVRMQHAAAEVREARELGYVGDREVAGGHHHVVELLGVALVARVVVHGHRELAGRFVVGDAARRRVEADVLAHPGLLDTALDVVEQHLTRRVGAHRPAEVLVEGVVGELQAFLGPVRPQVAVHAAVYRFAVFVEAGAPGVVPQSAPVRLLLEADQFGDVGAFLGGRLKSPELGQTAGSGSKYRDAFLHAFYSSTNCTQVARWWRCAHLHINCQKGLLPWE